MRYCLYSMFFVNSYITQNYASTTSSSTRASGSSGSRGLTKGSFFGARFNISNTFIYEAFTYSTARSATIKSYKVGIVYRVAQFVLLSYIIGWELIHNKGYQAFDSVSSVVTTKVKGQGFVPINTKHDKSLNKSDPDYYEKLYALNPKIQYKILDTTDYIVPPNEYNSIFIMTNYFETFQSQGKCDEELDKYKAICKNDKHCQSLGFVNTWNGIPTGRCVSSSVKDNISSCEIKGWCPAEHENERKHDTLIRNVLNYTIFIKNDIEFKLFSEKRRNILPNITNSYISQCLYDSVKDPYCPVFQVGYIVEKAEPDKEKAYYMLHKGGVILIEILWNCDFDLNRNKCKPVYSFRRFDASETNTATGFNFRFAHRYIDDGIEYRVLYKAYGLRFIINVSGTGGKFSVVPLMVSIGTGIGLMSLSVIIADCVMLHCTKNKSIYQKIKDLNFEDEITLKGVSQ